MRKLLLVVAPLLAMAVGVGFLVANTGTPTRSISKQAGPVLDSKKCLECHANEGMVKRTAIGEQSLYVDGQALASSTHRYLDCTACHSGKLHQGRGALTKQSEVETCGSCHAYQRDQYRESIHGEALNQGADDAPSCAACHSPEGDVHAVAQVLEIESPTFRKNIASTCAKCHADEDLIAKYGWEEVYASYQHSVHGKAMALASNDPRKLNKATCSDCHGSHDARSADAADSRVGTTAALAETCASCHKGADENYARGFVGHKEASRDYFPLVYYGERFFFLLTASVVFFGILLVSFEGYRWLIGGIHRDRDDTKRGG